MCRTGIHFINNHTMIAAPLIIDAIPTDTKQKRSRPIATDRDVTAAAQRNRDRRQRAVIRKVLRDAFSSTPSNKVRLNYIFYAW